MSKSKLTHRFLNKVVVVTGATSGIGEETALAFAREGAKLVIAGRRSKEGRAVLQKLNAIDKEAIFIQTDVTSEQQNRILIKKTVDTFDRVDIAVNNAGAVGMNAPVTEQTEENYRQIFDVNVLGVLLSMKHQIKQMQRQKFGVIINMSSIAGLVGLAGGSVYHASKHAVLGLTKCASLEVAQTNIRINAVCPGVINTKMASELIGNNPKNKAYLASLHAMNRLGKASEVSDAIMFLASDQASFITGQHLTVDGGYTAK